MDMAINIRTKAALIIKKYRKHSIYNKLKG